jgi:hypothetical protein
MNDKPHDHWMEILRRKVADIRYGHVQITVHEGRVTQVESTEKTRIDSDPKPSPLPSTSQPRRSPAA